MSGVVSLQVMTFLSVPNSLAYEGALGGGAMGNTLDNQRLHSVNCRFFLTIETF